MPDWYVTDGSSQIERSHSGRMHDTEDIQLGTLLRLWSLRDDPREPMGAIVLVQFADGFAIRYLGPEMLDERELMRRVVYIGDAVREANP
jgi:hypothetical protein